MGVTPRTNARAWQRPAAWLTFLLLGAACEELPIPATDVQQAASELGDWDRDGWPSCPTDAQPAAGGCDCDDRDPSLNPGRQEVCDGPPGAGRDNDCDGAIDEGIPLAIWLPDADGDGFPRRADPAPRCDGPPEGRHVGFADAPPPELEGFWDCDDNDPRRSPEALEICNDAPLGLGEDDDCDGRVDEGLPAQAWYRDRDADGVGAQAAPVVLMCAGGFPDCERLGVCEANESLSRDPLDCDDNDPTTYPATRGLSAAPEVCDEGDNDCDGQVDEELSTFALMLDLDGDGYGQQASAPSGAADSLPASATIHTCDPAAAIGSWQDSTSGLSWALTGGDCDDLDPYVHPQAEERCDGRDEDCDGLADEDLELALYTQDFDHDRYGGKGEDDEVPAEVVLACAPPSSDWAPLGRDCRPLDPAYHPGAPEPCDEDKDYNCDGSVGYQDRDHDGHPACTECDDRRPDVHPGAFDACDGVDNDCDGFVDNAGAQLWYDDQDGDGYGDSATVRSLQGCFWLDAGMALSGGDCDDQATTGASIHPLALEICDGIDQDCDFEADEGIPTTPWYRDRDGDGYGDSDSPTVDRCLRPEGYAQQGGDCDDADPAVHPWASPHCGGVADQNCDGSVDDQRDVDGDGVSACQDCDDGDPTVPLTLDGQLAEEVCDGRDNDCDGQVDNAPLRTVFHDGDRDGFGDISWPLAIAGCDSVAIATNPDDCDDRDANVHPGATERCDGKDSDCDGDLPADEVDVDDDGYFPCAEGEPEWDCDDADPQINPGRLEVCDGGPIDEDCSGDTDDRDADGDGYVAVGCPGGLDCDDADPAIHPGAPESCDGVDNDCDRLVDDEDDDVIDPIRYYEDPDQDGYYGFLDLSTVYLSCEPLPPRGYAAIPGDCAPQERQTHPGAEELCDWRDNDCDRRVDEGVRGPDSTGCSEAQTQTLRDADLTFIGYGPYSDAGQSVWLAGDINGDDFDDILIGAPAEGVGEPALGGVYLILGPRSGPLDAWEADSRITGYIPDGAIGQVVTSPGDVNGDGFDDVLIGSGGANEAYLFFGPLPPRTSSCADADVRLTGNQPDDRFGSMVGGVGDINGDSYPDIAVGAFFEDVDDAANAGKVYIFYGGPSLAEVLPASAAPVTILGSQSGELLGAAFTAGDFDNDGAQELVVGAPGYSLKVDSLEGAAYVITAPRTPGVYPIQSLGRRYIGEAPGDSAGSHVAAVGDLLGDGREVVLVGARREDTGGDGAGATYVLPAPQPAGEDLSLSLAYAKIIGESPGDAASVVAAAGDVNGDHIDDLVIGAPKADAPESDSGAAYVVFGPIARGLLSLTDSDARIGGAYSFNLAGSSVAGGGDVNADGLDDLIIGAPQGELNGAAGLFLGGSWD